MPEKILWKVEYGFKNVHFCEAVVITCLDFRFRWQTAAFIRQYLNFEPFDLSGLPGASNRINSKSKAAVSCFSVPCDLHGVKKIIIVHHQDCGAYGGSEGFNDAKQEQEFHEEELRKSREKILKMYPDQEVILIYARLDEKEENIEFVLVE